MFLSEREPIKSLLNVANKERIVSTIELELLYREVARENENIPAMSLFRVARTSKIFIDGRDNDARSLFLENLEAVTEWRRR